MTPEERLVKLEAEIVHLRDRSEEDRVLLNQIARDTTTLRQAVESAKGGWHQAFIGPSLAAIAGALVAWLLAHMKWN